MAGASMIGVYICVLRYCVRWYRLTHAILLYILYSDPTPLSNVKARLQIQESGKQLCWMQEISSDFLNRNWLPFARALDDSACQEHCLREHKRHLTYMGKLGRLLCGYVQPQESTEERSVHCCMYMRYQGPRRFAIYLLKR